jgi:hypothetical protein
MMNFRADRREESNSRQRQASADEKDMLQLAQTKIRELYSSFEPMSWLESACKPNQQMKTQMAAIRSKCMSNMQMYKKA